MNNKKQEIIQTLKENYNRDLRKQVVKTLLQEEKVNKEPNYKIINQIFSYVLKELEWEMPQNTQEWDNTPLDIIEETFPKITSTLWFKGQILAVEKIIAMKIED